ncbi:MULTISPECIES: hypothetical protein [unclassified Pseudactinotalea]|uniref:hypothetical protein n=1 Tax=unclassified Pseudactinotalea TaxID=2649176 RepID=UPI00128B1C09|nr:MULTISPECIES: hypothetical protein [unclassified Pseudactinotalea]MPV49929.1 hypothetical protein [Pseudactinotalea sp. HY160]QGH69190.1 hypothetical protein GCE65_06445 [Pseudactinotalea sp. HY158]
MNVRSRRLSTVAAALTAAALLAACGVLPDGGAAGDEAPSGRGGSAAGDPPVTLAPQLQDCGTGGEDQLTLADTDLTRATWDLPEGFEVTGGYYEDNPVEENILDLWVAKPVGTVPTLNVLDVVSYDGLQWTEGGEECGAVPLSAVSDRLAHYRQVIGAVPLDDPELTEVGGYPAMRQSLEVSKYSYEGYWLFSTTQLLHIYCQWTDPAYEEIITDGCAELIASVEVDAPVS